MNIAVLRIPSNVDPQADSARATVPTYAQAPICLEDTDRAFEAHDFKAHNLLVQAAFKSVMSLYLDHRIRQRFDSQDRLVEPYAHVIGQVLQVNLLLRSTAGADEGELMIRNLHSYGSPHV